MNALIDTKNPPNFPAQLGCSGFVVIDGNGKFLTTKTPRFLDYGEEAFFAVEKLLDENIPSLREMISTPGQEQSMQEKAINRDSDKKQSLIAQKLPNVGHREMDEEHDIIVECLNILARDKTKDALREVSRVFSTHCKNEEKLLLKLGFGGNTEFSAYKSHSDDHRKIFDLMDSIASRQSEEIVSSTDISNLIYVIEVHAERFDTLYAMEALSSTTSS